MAIYDPNSNQHSDGRDSEASFYPKKKVIKKKFVIKTIDVNALEWFDKAAGNSYFAATVSINYGMDDAVSFVLPFQYGYGDQYREETWQQLVKRGFIPSDTRLTHWRYYQDNNIITRHIKRENCKQRELKSLGK